MGEKIKDLTLKQKKFLKVYFETGNATKAALAAYETDDPHSASIIGSENLAKLGDVVRYIMNRKGLDVEKLVDTVNGAMEANKVISAQVIVKKDNPTSQTDGELPPADSKTNDFIEVPDHPTRLKAVEIAERWLGMKQETPNVAIQFNNFVKQEKDEFGL